jgi:hypothetical protein
VAALASGLGIDEAKVRSALDGLRPEGPDRRGAHGPRDGGPMVDELATKLGIDAAKLRAAIEKVRADRPAGPKELAAALAKELGIDESKVQSAMRPDGPHGVDAAAIAKALGADEAKVQDVLDKQRAAHEAAEAKERDVFAAALAKKLNLSVDKVKSALAAQPGPGHGPGHGHGPRRHP